MTLPDFLRLSIDLVRSRARRRPAAPPVPAAQPTVFHITHYKAGSQWIHRIFHALDYHRLVLPDVQQAQFFEQPIVPGKIYPTLYLTREQFESVAVPPGSRRFVVIRDLRDTLVSAYFSLRYSHAPMSPQLQEVRRTLSGLSQEKGLVHLFDVWLPNEAQIQWSWLAAGEPLIRYEDLLVRDVEILERVLIGTCALPVTSERLREIVLANRFEAWTKGRPRGQEDSASHERKGIVGDWKNHFTDPFRRDFKLRYGSVLIATGYERDFNW
jgi:hypothetical protein